MGDSPDREQAPNQLRTILDLVGHDWFAYVANATPEQVAAAIAGSHDALDASQTTALQSALTLAAQRLASSEGPPDSGQAVQARLKRAVCEQLEVLANWSDPLNGSLADNLRSSAGGMPMLDTAFQSSSDPLLDDLYRLSLRAWPTLLLPAELDPFPWPTVFLVSPDDPYSIAAQREITQDASLRKLFPGVDPQVAAQSPREILSDLWTDDAMGGTIYLSILPSIIIGQAIWTMLLRDTTMHPEHLRAEIMAALRRLRSLANGQTVHFPTFYPMNGLEIGDVQLPIKLPTGQLHRPGPIQKQVAKYYETPNYRPTPSAIFETTRPVSLAMIHGRSKGQGPEEPIAPFANASFRKAFEASELKADQPLTQFRIALLLTRPVRSGLIAPRFLCQQRITALAQYPRFIPLQTGQGLVRGASAFDQEASEGLVEWLSTLKEAHPSSLDFALRRLVSAVDRDEPADGLVDAVIAWEALFTKSVETKRSVTFALSLCCEPHDLDARVLLQKAAGRLYDARSTVVHGQLPKARDLEEDRKEAVEYALRALSWIYRETPHLLTLDPATRSKMILLRGPSG